MLALNAQVSTPVPAVLECFVSALTTKCPSNQLVVKLDVSERQASVGLSICDKDVETVAIVRSVGRCPFPSRCTKRREAAICEPSCSVRTAERSPCPIQQLRRQFTFFSVLAAACGGRGCSHCESRGVGLFLQCHQKNQHKRLHDRIVTNMGMLGPDGPLYPSIRQPT